MLKQQSIPFHPKLFVTSRTSGFGKWVPECFQGLLDHSNLRSIREGKMTRWMERIILVGALDNSAHHCCLCSWSSRRTFQFNDDDDNPLWSNVTDNYKSLHSSFLMQRRWKKTFVMKIVIKTFTSLWCNDDDDDDYRNLNSSLMQSPFWHRNCSAEHPIVFASFPKPNYTIKHISLLLIIIPSFIYWLWDLPRVQDMVTYLFQAQAPSRRISHEQDRTWKSEK